MSLAVGPVRLLRIGTDNNKHCMNNVMALAFAITSLLSPLSFCLCISTLSALQQIFREGREGREKRREMTAQGFQNQV